MHLALLIPLTAALVAAAVAGAIASRDPGQRATRLVVLVLLCSVHWSLCEVAWGLSDDPRTVRWLIKASSLGWLWLGPLCLHVLVEIGGRHGLRLQRLLPFAYGSAALGIVLYVATPWCVAEPVRTSWGWGITFGPLFPFVVVPTFGWVIFALVRLPGFFAAAASRGERREGRWLFVGIAAPVAVAGVTDVLLPLLGVQVPRFGSASVVIVGAVVARSLSRYGYFLLAPGAFTGAILDALRDGVALVRQDGTIHACNDALGRLWGGPAERLRGQPIAALIPELGHGPVASFGDRRASLLRRDGSSASVAVSASALCDDRGAVIGRAVAVRDLRDVEALRGRLVTAGRLAAVGELAAGIAHEINTPVTWVRANLGTLREHWEALAAAAHKSAPDSGLDVVAAEGEEVLDESLEGVERVAAIVRHVAAFAHAGLGESEHVDLNQVLDDAVNVVALSYSVMVERDYGEIPPVRGAPQDLKQVFLNLLLNALQAIGDYGRIRLVTRRVGDRVSACVEDDGCGIPEDAVERVFDPFFTTRPGEAVGLGLAHCYQIVQRHGGEIRVESRRRHGASFEVLLPCADAEPAPTAGGLRPAPASGP
jgi:signal transduction histidine kinase